MRSSAYETGRRLLGHRDVRDRFGTVIYLVGTAAEVSLIVALAGTAVRNKSRRRLRSTIVPMLAERVFSLGVGELVERRRPGNRATRPFPIGPSSSSFPSGHSSSAFASAALLTQHGSRAVVVYPLAAVSALSRVLLRVHRFSDVIPSAIAGAAIAHATASLLDD